jgi:hypothetical protein
MTRQDQPTRRINPDELKTLGAPVELRCLACGQARAYKVGHLLIDPQLARQRPKNWLNDAIAFTANFHSAH